jgi:hypothetical protein
MRFFFDGQGRTRVFGEAYTKYAAAGNPRRTKSIGKKTIYGWTLFDFNAVDILFLVIDLIYEVILRRIKVQYNPQFFNARV